MNLLTRILSTKPWLAMFLIISVLLTSCGGNNANSAKNVQTPTPVVSQIPSTPAISSIEPLVPQSMHIEQQQPTSAILRHVHRNSAQGTLTFDNTTVIDSDNAIVEQRNRYGLYEEVARQTDFTYHISVEQNGLAYFRVTNTKPNGSTRVYNFYGVPAGYYMSFDTTNSEQATINNPLSDCKNVHVRLKHLPNNMDNSHLMINGKLITDAIVENTAAYIKTLTICPIDTKLHFLAVAAIEINNVVHYGFNFYQTIKDDDLIELNIDHQANMVPWQSDEPIGDDFQLLGIQYGWDKYITLYQRVEGDDFSGYIPQFTELNLSSYRLLSEVGNASQGFVFHHREIAPDISTISFQLNGISLQQARINPLSIQWQNEANLQPKVVGGLVFNSQLTQTYAFISMDESVINHQEFQFPLDQLSLTADSTLVAVTAASPADKQLNFISQASIYSGVLYWQTLQPITADNSDSYITSNAAELLQTLLNQ